MNGFLVDCFVLEVDHLFQVYMHNFYFFCLLLVLMPHFLHYHKQTILFCLRKNFYKITNKITHVFIYFFFIIANHL